MTDDTQHVALPTLCETCLVTRSEGSRSLVSAFTVIKHPTSDNSAALISPPLTWSMVEDVEKICLVGDKKHIEPGGSSTVGYGVLTSEDGSRVYVFILQIGGCNFHLFSAYRRFRLMTDLLRALSHHLADEGRWELEVQDMLKTLSHIVMPAGDDLVIPIPKFSLTLTPPLLPGTGDLPLTLPFYYFTHLQILQIVSSILSEQQIVFISDNNPIRVLLIETFLSYIKHLEWQVTYLPTLPEALFLILEAPVGQYILGAESGILDEIPTRGDIVVVNIDKGEVNLGSIEEGLIRTLEYKVTKFEQCIPKSSLDFEISIIGRCFTTQADYEREKEDFKHRTELKILVFFQEILIELIGDQIFPEATTCPTSDQLSGNIMVSSLVHSLKTPLLKKTSMMEQIRSASPNTESFIRSRLDRTPITVAPNLLSVDRLVTEHQDNPATLSSLLYIKSQLLLKDGLVLSAFTTLNKIFEVAGAAFFPGHSVFALMERLRKHPDLLGMIRDQPFADQPVWAPLFNSISTAQPAMPNIEFNKTWNRLTISEVLKEMGVTRDHTAGEKVFDLLKDSRGEVSGEDWTSFLSLWGGLKDSLVRNLPFNLHHKPNMLECFVKISQPADSSQLNSITLVCTVFRLYFIHRITGQIVDSISLSEMSNFKLKTATSLQFKLRNGDQKEAVNIRHATHWVIILEEVICGLSRYTLTKNQSIIQEVVGNILLYEALVAYEAKQGEIVEVDSTSGRSSFYRQAVRHAEVLAFRKSPVQPPSSTEHVLTKFRPDPDQQETVVFVVAGERGNVFVGTRSCTIYKISVEDNSVIGTVKLMTTSTNPKDWELFGACYTMSSLCVTLQYKQAWSLYEIECGGKRESGGGRTEFGNYKTFPLNRMKGQRIIGMSVMTLSHVIIVSDGGEVLMWSSDEKKSKSADLGEPVSCVERWGQSKVGITIRGKILQLGSLYNSNFVTWYENEQLPALTSIRPVSLSQSISTNAEDDAVFAVTRSGTIIFIKPSQWGGPVTIEPPTPGISFYTIAPPTLILARYHPNPPRIKECGKLVLSSRSCALHVYDLVTKKWTVTIDKAHSDLIPCIVTLKKENGDKVAVTGARSADGTIGIWKVD
eukprot:sb/3461375/